MKNGKQIKTDRFSLHMTLHRRDLIIFRNLLYSVVYTLAQITDAVFSRHLSAPQICLWRKIENQITLTVIMLVIALWTACLENVMAPTFYKLAYEKGYHESSDKKG